MTILRTSPNSCCEISLESTDGELIYPSSFVKISGFGAKLKENCSYFDPIEIVSELDQYLFADLIAYCIQFSTGRVLDEPIKEKRFIIRCSVPHSHDIEYCAYDCQLTEFHFMSADRHSTEEPGSSSPFTLKFQPRYIDVLYYGSKGEESASELGQNEEDSLDQINCAVSEAVEIPAQ